MVCFLFSTYLLMKYAGKLIDFDNDKLYFFTRHILNSQKN
jgi:ABC-type transporter MlaC component